MMRLNSLVPHIHFAGRVIPYQNDCQTGGYAMFVMERADILTNFGAQVRGKTFAINQGGVMIRRKGVDVLIGPAASLMGKGRAKIVLLAYAKNGLGTMLWHGYPRF